IDHFVSSFFFSCSRPHRDLPSFPTRRSSDLQVGVGPAAIVCSLTRDRDDHIVGSIKNLTDHPLKNLRVRVGGKIGEFTLRQETPDRKSTRLNSSHLVISYAVFCLKKKKNIRTERMDAWQESLMLIVEIMLMRIEVRDLLHCKVELAIDQSNARVLVAAHVEYGRNS